MIDTRRSEVGAVIQFGNYLQRIDFIDGDFVTKPRYFAMTRTIGDVLRGYFNAWKHNSGSSVEFNREMIDSDYALFIACSRHGFMAK